MTDHVCLVALYFSIHALLAESDVGASEGADNWHIFYPRSPCGERPPAARHRPAAHRLFYPRSPCGERHNKLRELAAAGAFLSTLSLRRATAQFAGNLLMGTVFYPRSPCGERRTLKLTRGTVLAFSIHALLAESDAKLDILVRAEVIFLSTLSLRRATT